MYINIAHTTAGASPEEKRAKKEGKMEIFYEKYVNIQKFITEYRKYKIKEKFHSYEDFRKFMQSEHYIKHTCVDERNGLPVYMYLFHEDSMHVKTTAPFKKLVDRLPEEKSDVIIISKNELSVYIKKAILTYPHLNIFNYLHKHFSIELALGPLCSKHRILPQSEVETLCAEDLIIHPLMAPSISINDPQNIWIGGKLGDLIEISAISEIAGQVIRYRIVSPDSGKALNIQKIRESIREKREKKKAEEKIEVVDVSESDDDDE